MKNVHPIYMIIFSLVMFAIGFLDAELTGATSLQELSWWGKTAVILFSAPLAYWFFGWLIAMASKDD